jgi:hypothetical protein
MNQVLGKDLTTHEAYLLLVPAIINTSLDTVYQHLIDFSTVAVTEPSSTSLEPLTVKPWAGCTMSPVQRSPTTAGWMSCTGTFWASTLV